MNSLASILYSSSPAKNGQRKNLSLQPSDKPLPLKSSRCEVGMLFRSSTPKTPLQPRTKATVVAAHPASTSSSTVFLSSDSPQRPRCSTPLFAKQRRTRPFLVCELCRQRAFQSANQTDKKPSQQHHQHSATLQYYQHQTNTSSLRYRHRRRQRSSIDQLLVWIV